MFSLFKNIYLTDISGKIALFCLLLSIAAPYIHFFGGAPAFSSLSIKDGHVVKITSDPHLKGNTFIKLIINTKENNLEEITYLLNRGESIGQNIKNTLDKDIRAWVGSDQDKTIYQLHVDNQTVIDYQKRNEQLSGSSEFIFMYTIIFFIFFLFHTIQKYRIIQSKCKATNNDAAVV
jgi:hypothetical protein